MVVSKKEILKKYKYLKIAARRLHDQTDIKKYSSGINWVKKNLSRKHWFQDIEEIILILELHRMGFRRFKRFKKIILLPEKKIIIKIEKERVIEESKKNYWHIKEHQIFFGYEWEVISLSGHFINNNITTLNSVIKEIYYCDWRYWNAISIKKALQSSRLS